MKAPVAERLEALRQDFAKTAGQPFRHFYCPILFVDEQAELCQAHIVNRAFPATSRKWTVQREDVDSFFGSKFEGSFTNLRFDEPGIATKAITDSYLSSIKRGLSKKIRKPCVSVLRVRSRKPREGFSGEQ